jgi:oxygen-dependent protoporphyrinogen oxidase
VDTFFNQRPIAVIGAGLTGLSAALALSRAGRPVTVFDSAPEVGGVIRSERHADGWLIESGPNSLQETPALAALVEELGLRPSRQLAAPEAKNRYIVRDGRLRPLPMSPPAFLRSDLFSFRTKARLLREYFRRPLPRTGDLPLADFFREHFGQELLDYALDPFVSGIYAGDASRLSARHAFPTLWKAEQEHGSLIKAQLVSAREKRARGHASGPPPIISFTQGLASLPRALAAGLPAGSIRLGVPVTQLSRTPSGWIVDAAPTQRFSHVILALPAPALARLGIGAPGAQASLASLDHLLHPPVTSLFLGYRRADIAHPLDGFGVLLPSIEKRPLLGVLFNSTLFAGRAPAGHVALTVMVGGARNPELAGHPLDYQLPVVQKELVALLGVRAEPVFVRRTHWPRAIPQYLLDHDAHREVIRAAEARNPGLHIGGPVIDGIGLPACVTAGRRLAEAALAR